MVFMVSEHSLINQPYSTAPYIVFVSVVGKHDMPSFSGLRSWGAVGFVSLKDVSAFVNKGTYAKIDLERVVDEPLEGSQRADHEDTDRQSVPKPLEPNITIYS
jgi:hypothetical protein